MFTLRPLVVVVWLAPLSWLVMIALATWLLLLVVVYTAVGRCPCLLWWWRWVPLHLLLSTAILQSLQSPPIRHAIASNRHRSLESLQSAFQLPPDRSNSSSQGYIKPAQEAFARAATAQGTKGIHHHQYKEACATPSNFQLNVNLILNLTKNF